jgi:hypothetical protein
MHSPNSVPIRPIPPPYSLHRCALQEQLRVRRIRSSGCGEKCIDEEELEEGWDAIDEIFYLFQNGITILLHTRGLPAMGTGTGWVWVQKN